MFRKILIANRGEIACRIIRTCRRLGIATVAVHSDADRDALFVEMADEAVSLGGQTAAQSYLKAERIIAAALSTGAEAIHPGYGFLSENPDFAEAVAKAGLRFIGPPASAIRAMGLKDAAKAAMEKAGVPVVPGYHGAENDAATLAAEARRIGFPVLIKARAGGGGKGMRKVERAEDFAAALDGARHEAQASFGDPACLIEKYVTHPRHIEIQVFADDHGEVVHLFERDCSAQRRHQKVIEEAPAPGMPEEMRAAMGKAAVTAARAIGYSGAGTVEFIADASEGLRMDRFWFMEMNTRLQVEHPVTEAITGVDLVEWQLRVAAGEPLPLRQDALSINGWAMEARLYAENPSTGFLPSTGLIRHLRLPDTLARVDTGIRRGDLVTPFYDPMIAKIIVHGESREAALDRLVAALDHTEVSGVETNSRFLARLARQADFAAGHPDTGLIARALDGLLQERPPEIEIKALAALLLGGLHERSADPDPWASLTGFRAFGEAEEIVALAGPDGLETVYLTHHDRDGWRARIGDGECRLRLVITGPLQFRLEAGGHGRVGSWYRDGDRAVIRIGEDEYVFRLHDPTPSKEAATGGNQVTAPMPGLVKRLQAKVGDTVRAGDALLVMEAMKMELTLPAPRDGQVAAVNCSEGMQVSEGTVLVRLDAGEEA